jgi:hypothetical protein
MRTIPLTRSILTFWEDLVFLEAALLADDDTKDLAASVTELLESFPGILKSELDSRRAVLQAFARSAVADTLLDTAIRKVFSAVLHLVSQNRKRAEFTTLFKTHIGNVVRYALKRQLEVADELVTKLALAIYPVSFRDEQKSVLAPVIDKGKAVLADQTKAELGRVEGRIAVRAWKEDVNGVRLSVQGQLTTLAGKTGRGKDWVETFFLKRTDGAGEETEIEASEGQGDPNGSEGG